MAQTQALARQSLDAATEQAWLDRLCDRWWRLTHLYKIQDKAGNIIAFNPNDVQTVIDDELWHLNLFLKSRQHGVTTYFCIRWLDECLFRSGTKAGIIAHRRDDAKKFFNEKVLLAYENLPDWIKGAVPQIKRLDRSGYIEFDNHSTYEVGTSLRGASLQRLHISEYGPLCAMFPQRADEVRTGSLNTVQSGQIVTIESTAYGRQGDFFKRCQKAQQHQEKVAQGAAELTKMDWKFFFFPWFMDAQNTMDAADAATVPITKEMREYFKTVEAEMHVTLTPGQRAWYTKKADDQGDKMKREHPSTPAEAFEASLEGAYYARELAKARQQGRILRIPLEPHIPVNTFWDLGKNDANAIWFMQAVGKEYRFVDYYENNGEAIHHYARKLIEMREERKWVYDRHYLPHDAAVAELTREDGKTREQVLQSLGIRPTVIVPRISNIGEGIDMVRQMFPKCWFDEEHCDQGINALENYTKEWDPKRETWKDYPAHTWASNGADAFRQCAQGYTGSGMNRSLVPEVVNDY